METVTIKIKMLADIPEPKPITLGDWIDLRAAETVMMSKGEYKEIRLGVAMELPEGYEAMVIPRSSIYKRHERNNQHGNIKCKRL